MCGRYVSARTEPELIDDYAVVTVDAPERPAPSWNVAPTRRVWAVLPAPGGRALTAARWGLVPPWAPDPSVGARMINARLETVADKPAFRAALRARRCLVPADGYYEWSRDANGVKRPWLLRAAAGGGLTFAGLYELWRDRRDPDAPPLLSVTVLTTAASGVAGTLHDRMPVLLPPAAWTAWLDPATADPAAALGVVAGAAPAELAAVPVARAVGDVRNDGPHLLAEVPVGAGAELAEEPAPTLF